MQTSGSDYAFALDNHALPNQIGVVSNLYWMASWALQ